MNKEKTSVRTGMEIAVIGMAAQFPGARNIYEFRENLENGVESISFYSSEELELAGVSRELLNDPAYVKAAGYFGDKGHFDASFFGYSPIDAELMDPQMRIFHQCVWEALEDAGYDPWSYKERIGLYAGATNSFNWQALTHLSGKSEEYGGYAASQLVNKDYLCTRISYSFNLKGASSLVQTACSTSLVAIHQACRALLTGESEMIVAGGSSVSAIFEHGYLYQEGMIFSADGHCRPFDAQSTGTVGGDGAGVVVLKRLKPALADRDHIYAIIRGSATNNDGRRKVGFSAPSVEAQAEAIRTAQRMARIDPETITYIEAHGTGTTLGDPVEIEALKLAFNTEKRNYCGVGSVKSNFGHLDAAAGVAGLIKTVLALKYKSIPPSLHFRTPNPNIDFKNSPFYVNSSLSKWETKDFPARAGVSSFGIGGTNAHVVLEEAPKEDRPSQSLSGDPQLIVISAGSAAQLDRATSNLGEYLENNSHIHLSDAAYTLQVGRKPFAHRRTLLGKDRNEVIKILKTPDSPGMRSFAINEKEDRHAIFMFSGQGAQYIDMARGLYQSEAFFREQMDNCFRLLAPLTSINLEQVIYPPVGTTQSPSVINATANAQPLLFILEYALAKLLNSWGITPYGMIGHSIGEYVAACLAGVFSLEDALKLVVNRGKLMQKMPAGAMLSVAISEENLTPLLKENPSVSLAAVNSQSRCVVSGTFDAIDTMESQLKEHGYEVTRLHTSHAYHSEMMVPILKEYEEYVRNVSLEKPHKPFISNVTGHWISAEDAVDPRYWANHIRKTVRFADGINCLLKEGSCIFIEIGPGKSLSSLVSQFKHPDARSSVLTLNMIRHPKSKTIDNEHLLKFVGQLWLFGIPVRWEDLYPEKKCYRVPLPTYPFNNIRYWIDTDLAKAGLKQLTQKSDLVKNPDVDQWFYVPVWNQSAPPLFKMTESSNDTQNWLIFMEDRAFDTKLVEYLEHRHQPLIKVISGERYVSALKPGDSYVVNPAHPRDYIELFTELINREQLPSVILHMWNVTGTLTPRPGLENLDQFQNRGFFSLLNIAQSIGGLNITDPVRIDVFTDYARNVTGNEQLCPEKATVFGCVKVIPLEFSNLRCRSFDIAVPPIATPIEQKLLHSLWADLNSGSGEAFISYRGSRRWTKTHSPFPTPAPEAEDMPFKENGVYLITGGFGGMGFTLAGYLALTFKARLILIGRTPLPERDRWDQWLADHEPKDRISVRILRIREWESHGAEIMPVAADIADLEQMTAAISGAEERFHKIDGVIHTAGVADFGGAIIKRSHETSKKYIASKLNGTLVLEHLFSEDKLDFMALFSSIGNVIYSGKFGQVSYNAGNEFLEAFGEYRALLDRGFTTVINWNDWKEVGMAVEALEKQVDGKTDELAMDGLFYDGLSSDEGVEVFKRIMGNRLQRVTVSTTDLVEKLVGQDIDLAPDNRDFLLGDVENLSDPQQTNLYQRPELSTPFAPPGTQVEHVLADIFQRLSGIEMVGIHDDFFELGGDSLKAMTVIAHINNKLNVQVPLAIFFDDPTIRKIGEFIGKLGKSQSVEIPPAEELEYYRLSPAQKRLYFLYVMDPDNTSYNQLHLYALNGEYNMETLEQGVIRLIRRHEILRSSFTMIDDEPAQIVHKNIEFSLVYGEHGVESPKEFINRFLKPFDLNAPPLVRMGTLKLEKARYLLLLDLHHIVSDGASNSIFKEELSLFYNGESLPPVKLQFKDFSQWHNSQNHEAALKKQEEYWLNQFSGQLPVLNLPTDFIRPAVQNFAGNYFEFYIEAEEVRQINELKSKNKITLFMLLMAFYNVFLAKLSHQEDIVVGIGIFGRNYEDLQRTMGMFVNTLAIRNYPENRLTFIEFLNQVKDCTLNATENQDYQLEDLVEKVASLTRAADRNPLFSVMFQLEDPDKPAGVDMPGLTFEYYPYEHDESISKFDLTLFALETKGRMRFTFEYSTELFKKDTIQWFADYFKEIVSAVLAQPDRKISEIGVIDDMEKSEKLSLFMDDLEDE